MDDTENPCALVINLVNDDELSDISFQIGAKVTFLVGLEVLCNDVWSLVVNVV